MDNTKEKVKKQFEHTGRNYRDSAIHAKGRDLEWIAEEIGRCPSPLLALDIATGAGHTAFALSRCVRRVVGYDLTPEMLRIAAKEAEQRGIDNVTWAEGDAERLPFPDRLFDVVTCRIAAHHFPRAERAFAEARRVLVPGGRMILVDNYVPEEADELLNRVETLRDPSHFRVHTLSGWTRLLRNAGFSAVTVLRKWETPVVLEEWFQRAKTPAHRQEEALRTLREAPQPTRELLLLHPPAEPAQLILRKGMWVAVR
ncbi:MAG: class I SAM-dependent methyltransferase [Planifilum fimeticola]